MNGFDIQFCRECGVLPKLDVSGDSGYQLEIVGGGAYSLEILGNEDEDENPAGLPDSSTFAVFGGEDDDDEVSPDGATAPDAALVFGALFSIPFGGPTEYEDDIFGDSEIIGGFFSDIVKAVAAPITAPIKAVATVAQGGNVLKAAKSMAVDPFKAQLKVGKAVVKSPIVKVGVGIAAIAFPPIGVPLAAGVAAANAGLAVADKVKRGDAKGALLAAGQGAAAAAGASMPPSVALSLADRAMRTAEGLRGTPAQQQAMKRAVTATVKLAHAGDAGARRAMEQMALSKRIRKTQEQTSLQKPKAQKGLLVVGKTIKRGVFQPA